MAMDSITRDAALALKIRSINDANIIDAIVEIYNDYEGDSSEIKRILAYEKINVQAGDKDKFGTQVDVKTLIKDINLENLISSIENLFKNIDTYLQEKTLENKNTKLQLTQSTEKGKNTQNSQFISVKKEDIANVSKNRKSFLFVLSKLVKAIKDFFSIEKTSKSKSFEEKVQKDFHTIVCSTGLA